MTAPNQDAQANTAAQQNVPSDKELNFRTLEAKYRRELEQERNARIQAERMAEEAMSKRQSPAEEEDDDSEPYVDNKKLSKKLSSFEKKLDEKIDKRAEEKARSYVEKERRDAWLRNNPDFHEVLQHAEKFAQKDPELAETILEMPNTFERQKLVYKNIKALGLHKPEQKAPSIQETVDANRRSPYYQPSGMAAAPYSTAGDFSTSGQKQAYEKMQQLKKQLRI